MLTGRISGKGQVGGMKVSSNYFLVLGDIDDGVIE